MLEFFRRKIISNNIVTTLSMNHSTEHRLNVELSILGQTQMNPSLKLSTFSNRIALVVLMFFLASLCAGEAAAQEGWKLINHERAGASVRLPGKPRSYSRVWKPVVDQDPIRAHLFQSTNDEKTATYVFSYHDENATPRNRVQTKKFLDGAVKGGVTRVVGKKITEEEIRISRHHGRDFIYTCTQSVPETTHLKIRTRVLIVGARVYQMNYITREEEFNNDQATEFFETFRFENIPNDLPPIPRPGRARAKADVAKS